MRNEKWLLAAGHYHLFHIISPLVARARGYFKDEAVRSIHRVPRVGPPRDLQAGAWGGALAPCSSLK